MIEKIKYIIWKIKIKVLDKVRFLLKKNLYIINLFSEKKCNNFLKFLKDTFKAFVSFISISIIIFGIYKVEEYLYNNINCIFQILGLGENVIYLKGILTFSKNYFFEFLIASLGMSGVLIALFYANLSGIFSSKYANLETELSYAILNEEENKRQIKSIRNYIITTVSLLMFYILGIHYKYLIMFLFVIYTVKIIIVFIELSKRIFYFSNLNSITKKECHDIYINFKNAEVKAKKYDDIDFQKYYYNNTRKSIDKLNLLIDTFIREEDYNAIVEFEENIIAILYKYISEKEKIPYNSLWYEECYKQNSLLKMSELDLGVYLNTGKMPNPEIVKNNNWIEEELFNLVILGISTLIENNKMIYSYRIFEKLEKLFEASIKYGNINKLTKEIIKVFDIINKKFNYDERNSFYIQAIIDIQTIYFMDVVLESIKYIETIKNIIDKINYKKISLDKLLVINKKIFNNEKVSKVCSQLLLEKKIEKKIITDEKYIKEFLYALIYQEISEILSSFNLILEYLNKFSQSMFEGEKYKELKILLARKIEIYNKMYNSYIQLVDVKEKIIKLKKNFIWKDYESNNLEDKIKENKINNIIMGIKVLKNLNFTTKETDDTEIDLFGLIFYNAYLMANQLLLEGDFTSYQKLYKYLFFLSSLCDTKIKAEIKYNGNNGNYAVNKYLKPYIYYMDLQGKMIYLSRLSEKKEWESLVVEELDRLKVGEILDTFVEYGKVDNDNWLNFDHVRDSMNRNFINSILEQKDVKSIEKIYGRIKIISEDEIISKFELMEDKFSEIYLYYYVNKYSNKKYTSKNNWSEEKNNE